RRASRLPSLYRFVRDRRYRCLDGLAAALQSGAPRSRHPSLPSGFEGSSPAGLVARAVGFSGAAGGVPSSSASSSDARSEMSTPAVSETAITPSDARIGTW